MLDSELILLSLTQAHRESSTLTLLSPGNPTSFCYLGMACVYVSVFVHIHSYMCAHVYVPACVFTCVYVFMCMFMCVLV